MLLQILIQCLRIVWTGFIAYLSRTDFAKLATMSQITSHFLLLCTWINDVRPTSVLPAQNSADPQSWWWRSVAKPALKRPPSAIQTWVVLLSECTQISLISWGMLGLIDHVPNLNALASHVRISDCNMCGVVVFCMVFVNGDWKHEVNVL